MNKQKILNIIIIVAVIALLGILGSITYEQKKNSEKDKDTTVSTNTNEIKNEIVEQKEDVTEEKEPEQEYVGQEEEDSLKEETPAKTKDEKVIKLAKQTWDGDDSVTFSIEEKKGFMYYVAVKSNATVISWYEVNTDTWEISEFY